MGLAADLRRFKTKGIDKLDAIVGLTIREFGGNLVTDWTPLGNPELWKSPPPADYRPGNLRSSWFYSANTPSGAITSRVDATAVNDLDDIPQHPAGLRHFLSNNAAHASSIEAGHSSQAPIGIMWSASEFAPMVYSITRRVG